MAALPVRFEFRWGISLPQHAMLADASFGSQPAANSSALRANFAVQSGLWIPIASRPLCGHERTNEQSCWVAEKREYSH